MGTASFPEGKYPTHLLLGNICLSDPWMILFNLASQAGAGGVVQTASQPSELSCSSQQEPPRDLSGNHVLSAGGGDFG